MNYETQKVNNSSSLSRGFVKAALNLGCMPQCVYQHGDGHASPDKGKTVDRIMSLFVNPIPLDWSNLNRYDEPYPTLAKCYESYVDLPAFQNAIPEKQPDAPASTS
ncbi:hypothetical protein F2Q68_00011298 [Brassica cretica]|uniref:Uncharacterized protein n=1 Tax=Brassica cretica TaxID=69181 RepID=A0A8S9KZ32_BRACR|nr:hypothetical protein F2Q68_00011298 [Brassica cretica]